MANYKLLGPKFLQWEGWGGNDPLDHGGATRRGITLSTWKQFGYDKNHDGAIDQTDLYLTTEDDFYMVFKNHFWDVWKADQINSQAIAEILVDWLWASGGIGIRRTQQILGLPIDGIVGPATLTAVNAIDPKIFYIKLQAARRVFIDALVLRDPIQVWFKKGWLNRINSYLYY